jgi:phenylalanine-4-hydroxylase
MQDLEQDWKAYTSEQHAIWRTLFHRQEAIPPSAPVGLFSMV